VKPQRGMHTRVRNSKTCSRAQASPGTSFIRCRRRRTRCLYRLAT